MSHLSLRRSLVVLVALTSLFAGAAAIRAAAGWTADAAPLGERPPDPGTLVQQLQDEQTRAAGLSDQLNEVTANAADLQRALEAAQGKAETDSSTADDLTAQLAEAKRHLADLEAQLAAARAATATTTVVTTATSPPPTTTTSSGEHEDEHDGEGGDD